MIEKHHKEFVLNALFGLIEGSPKNLESMMRENFKIHFKTEPDSLTVENTWNELRCSPSGYGKVWVGDMIVTLTIEDDTFEVKRDWGEEFDHDTNHPDYETDDWFYESDKCYNHQTYVKLKQELGIEGALCEYHKNISN